MFVQNNLVEDNIFFLPKGVIWMLNCASFV